MVGCVMIESCLLRMQFRARRNILPSLFLNFVTFLGMRVNLFQFILMLFPVQSGTDQFRPYARANVPVGAGSKSTEGMICP